MNGRKNRPGFCCDIGAPSSVIGAKELQRIQSRKGIPTYPFYAPIAVSALEMSPSHLQEKLDVLDHESLFVDTVTNRLWHRVITSRDDENLKFIDLWHVPLERYDDHVYASMELPKPIFYSRQDLLKLHRQFMHEATHFSAAQFLKRIDTATIWLTLLSCWACVYTGLPHRILVDRGSQFGQIFKTVAAIRHLPHAKKCLLSWQSFEFRELCATIGHMQRTLHSLQAIWYSYRREKQVNNRIGEWKGPHELQSVDYDRKIATVRDSNNNNLVPFNLAQVKHYLTSNQTADSFLCSLLSSLEDFKKSEVESIYLTEVLEKGDPRIDSPEMRAEKLKEIKNLINRGTFDVVCRREVQPSDTLMPARFVLPINHQKMALKGEARYVVCGNRDKMKDLIVHPTANCTIFFYTASVGNLSHLQ
eukprot:IDg8774t1